MLKDTAGHETITQQVLNFLKLLLPGNQTVLARIGSHCTRLFQVLKGFP